MIAVPPARPEKYTPPANCHRRYIQTMVRQRAFANLRSGFAPIGVRQRSTRHAWPLVLHMDYADNAFIYALAVSRFGVNFNP